MGGHGLIARTGGIAREFAGVKQSHEIAGRARIRSGLGKFLGDVVLAHVGGVHVELVGHIAEQGTVQLLIECGVEVLLEEVLRLQQTPARHLHRHPVLGSGDIGPPRSQSLQHEPCGRGQHEHQGHDHPEQGGTHEEGSGRRQRRHAGADEAHVGTHVAHIPALHP